MFTVAPSTRRGGTREQREEHDVPGFAVVAPDGSEVDFVSDLDGRGEQMMLRQATRLNEIYAGREVVRCKVCGAVSTSSNPDRYPYCKSCHYVGAAFEDISRDQIARFDSMLPEGWYVGIEHTGGGCFWLAARKQGVERYYILTDGEAGLPTNPESEERLDNGGWGYVGAQRDDEDGNTDEDNYSEFFMSHEALEDPALGLSDEAAIALIVADIEAQETRSATIVITYPVNTPELAHVAETETKVNLHQDALEHLVEEMQQNWPGSTVALHFTDLTAGDQS